MVIIIGTVTVIIGWVTLDKGLALYYRNMRPKLELRFRGVLGRPVELGSFQGLSLQGFHIGPSRVLASTDDQSQLNVEGLIVSLKPLASLQQGRWVVDLQLLNFRGDFWRNAQGSFWAIEPSEGRNPMQAAVWPHTREPSQFEIVQLFLGKLTEPDESRNLIGAEIRLHTLQIQGPGQLWIWLESESRRISPSPRILPSSSKAERPSSTPAMERSSREKYSYTVVIVDG